ncbi:MAG: transposase, partial [Spirochaetales bacterium]|nr:transposase [Spirochaetales bacterium]
MKDLPHIADIYKKFPTKEICIRYIEKIRWSNKPACPHCHSHRVSSMKKEFRYHCNACNVSFSVTVKTLFHNT